MTTELLNKGPALCLVLQYVKECMDKGERERNNLILEHYVLLGMTLHHCISSS